MNFYLDNNFEKKAKKLCSKNPKLRRTLSKQFKLFKDNPRHKSLKLHKLQGKRSTQYSIWIEGNLRAVCIKNKNTYIFFDIVTHDQY